MGLCQRKYIIDAGKHHIFMKIIFSIKAEIEHVPRITESSVAQGVNWNIGTTCIKCLCHIMSPLKRGYC